MQLIIHAGHDAVQVLDDRDLRAQPTPDTAQLQPDDARADHRQVLGDLVIAQRLGRGVHKLVVKIDAGDR